MTENSIRDRFSTKLTIRAIVKWPDVKPQGWETDVIVPVGDTEGTLAAINQAFANLKPYLAEELTK